MNHADVFEYENGNSDSDASNISGESLPSQSQRPSNPKVSRQLDRFFGKPKFKQPTVLQHAMLATFICVVAVAFAIMFRVLGSWQWFEWHMDGTWGFVLERGHEYTAPVWVSEFGAS
eukprot:CAMPEP_0172765390 /NCGR_PEP_ID=MMETSP1074-20121228/179170_1 /TAXON_ID=2916 /ORGANISM="Ceratium fusus, Strain PA161109" /LENGTH=116 /DNA_ID=CAMNT_0013600331 /DNA_START=194 /DNA_END=540 /DNA_ORIENTATION=+